MFSLKCLLNILRKNSYQLVKTSLILVTTVGAIVYGLNQNHQKLHPYYEKDFQHLKKEDYEVQEPIDRVLEIALKISIVFIVLFTVLFLYFIFIFKL